MLFAVMLSVIVMNVTYMPFMLSVVAPFSKSDLFWGKLFDTTCIIVPSLSRQISSLRCLPDLALSGRRRELGLGDNNTNDPLVMHNVNYLGNKYMYHLDMVIGCYNIRIFGFKSQCTLLLFSYVLK